MTELNAAITAFQKGDLVLMMDAASRENEADLVVAAEKTTEERIAFMIRHTSGIICVPMKSERLRQLGLRDMVDKNTSKHGCSFSVSVDAADIKDAGVSARDRLHTIRLLADPKTIPGQLTSPGHIFPLKTAEKGLLEREGHTEAAMALTELAGLQPAAVIGEVMDDKGRMIRGKDVEQFGREHGIPVISIQDLRQHILRTKILVKEEVRVKLPTVMGEFELAMFCTAKGGEAIPALIKGKPKNPALVRVHSECLTGDVFHSLRCDCHDQLIKSMERIEKEGEGVVIYLAQEGRGIGLLNKIKAYHLQEQGLDTLDANIHLGFDADEREYWEAAHILRALGITKIRLMTNNPDKIEQLEKLGLNVVERVSHTIEPNEHNKGYLKTKKERFLHKL
ncbi:MAG: GTP cyclohydrolase II [Nanoarchaeota archaeon]